MNTHFELPPAIHGKALAKNTAPRLLLKSLMWLIGDEIMVWYSDILKIAKEMF